MNGGWFRPGTDRCNVYMAVRAAPPGGIGLKALHRAAPDITYAKLGNLLYHMRIGGYIAHPDCEDSRGRYCVTSACIPPRICGYETRLLIELLADVGDAGAGVDVLAEEAHLTTRWVGNTLRPMVTAGQVQAFKLPEKHGGGPAYRLRVPAAPLLAAMPELPPIGAVPAAPAASPAQAPVPQPVPGPGPCTSGCDDGAFALLPDKRFAIRLDDGSSLTLSTDSTRRLFHFLDRLGGLHCSAQLAGAAS